MKYRHNFGHDGPINYFGLGINAKMSELQAAMGLSVLPYMSKIMEERKRVVDFYDTHLNFSRLQKVKIREQTQWNYAYYPVIFPTEDDLLKTLKRLNDNGVNPRRYFYPSLEELPYIKTDTCPIAKDIASRVLCLPLYAELSTEQIDLIAESFKHAK